MSEKATERLKFENNGTAFTLSRGGMFLGQAVASGSLAAKRLREEYSGIVKAVNNYDELASIAGELRERLTDAREFGALLDAVTGVAVMLDPDTGTPLPLEAVLQQARAMIAGWDEDVTTALSRYTAFMEGKG